MGDKGRSIARHVSQPMEVDDGQRVDCHFSDNPRVLQNCCETEARQRGPGRLDCGGFWRSWPRGLCIGEGSDGVWSHTIVEERIIADCAAYRQLLWWKN